MQSYVCNCTESGMYVYVHMCIQIHTYIAIARTVELEALLFV